MTIVSQNEIEKCSERTKLGMVGAIKQGLSRVSMVNLDENGYFASDESCVTKTNGVFVAGDCRQKSIRQITTATADGATAALAACRYIDAI